MPKRLWVVGVSSLLAAACSKDVRLAPLLPPCTASGDSIKLMLAAYAAPDPGSSSGCMVFPANPSASPIQYLLVPQAAGGVPDDSSSFLLRGAALAAAPPLAAPPAASSPPTVPQQFDLALRRSERDLAGQTPVPRRTAPPPGVFTAPTPVDSGNVRTFRVCDTLACDPRRPSTLTNVTAIAQKVGQHIALYVDTTAPKPGLSQADLDTLRALFDTLLYRADTLAFGHESDIDNNGMVIVLMTGKVNSLVSNPCTNGFVAGYFYGADLLPAPYGTGNNGEIFYSIVPDPTGTLSCAHTVAGVKHTVPGTFIHEFQHMISWGHHVLSGGGLPEDLWLNEGLSHYAEELGARLFTPGDSTTFCYFIFGDLYNANQYFASPQSSFLVDTAGIGGLPNRGAYWLFVRFLVDRFSSDTSRAANNVVTRTLDQTSLTGAANVANLTGVPFATTVQHWALANYVSDLSLPGFTAPSELQYKKWRFRSDFPAIHTSCLTRTGSASFPPMYQLFPTMGTGSGTDLSGTLRGGSGTYHIAQQAAGAMGFTLLFSDGTGRALRTSLVPRLNVIRIQ